MISAFFTADYRDGRVIFGGKSYPAGVFATHLLNQFYINDTAARIMQTVQENAMQGHFVDMKQAYVFGIYKALQKYDISTGVPFLIFKEHYLCRQKGRFLLRHRRRMDYAQYR